MKIVAIIVVKPVKGLKGKNVLFVVKQAYDVIYTVL